jgi:hypothetical protein
MIRHALLPICLLLAVLVSGCTIPGMGTISIPGVGTIGDKGTLSVSSIEAVPGEVAEGQSTTLVAYIENKGTRTINATTALYDTCGLFSITKLECGPYTMTGKACSAKLSSKEKTRVAWSLKSGDVSVYTQCDLKIKSDYNYTTTGVTTMHLINPDEMNRQLGSGTFRELSSDVTFSDGPIRVYVTVQDKQPISSKEATLLLNAENVGSGSLATAAIPKGAVRIRLPAGMKTGSDCDFAASGLTDITALKEDITLIGKKSPPMPCKISITGDVPTTLTRNIEVMANYTYSIRDSARGAVKPTY